MTKTLLLFSALVCMQHANAQAQKKIAFSHQNAHPATPAKTTANASRLIAATTRSFQSGNLEIQDSAHCWYTSGYGYDYARDQWKFDHATDWDYDGSSYTEAYHVTNTIDANGHVTMSAFEEFDGSNWITDEIEKYSYNAQGQTTVELYASFDGSQWDSMRTTYTYNAQGRLAQQANENWDNSSSQWVQSDRFTNTYDANGNLTLELQEFWDGNNNQYAPVNRTTNTYVNNLLTVALFEYISNGQWINAGQTLYTYNAQGNVTLQENQNWGQGAWVPGNRITNTYNSTNDMITSTREDFILGQFETQGRRTMTYNNYHQVLVETEEGYNTTTGQFEMQDGNQEMRNYYEEYTNSVKDTKAAGGNFSVYPVPAKGVLHLRTSLNEATSATIQLLDMNGRVVKQQQLPTAKQFNTAIDIANLPAGNYIMQLNASGKVMTQKVTVE